MVLRRATEKDIAAIHAIEVASFSDPWSAASFRSMLAQPQVRATVALRDGVLVGYAVAWVIADEAELANLAVAPAARGAGVGAALTRELLSAIDAAGGATVYLEVREGNSAALALYRGLGFDESGRRKGYYRRPVEDAIVMCRPRAAGARPD